MDRRNFLDRVRDAARAGERYRVAVANVPADAGYVGAGDDPPARLAAEIEAVGGRTHLVIDINSARRRLDELIQALRPRQAICWEHPLLDALDVRGQLAAAGVTATSHTQLTALPTAEQRAALLSADVGIAAADWAVAETGSLAVAARPGQERAITLLPPVLVSVVDASRIVPDLFDLFAKLGAGPTADTGPALPSNLALITGPSKTGDIELQLTTGVHGPGQWQVIIIRNAD